MNPGGDEGNPGSTGRRPVGIISTMSPAATDSASGRPWSTAAASLVPWASFLLAATVFDILGDHTSAPLVGLAASSPFYLAFVALPSLLALAAAPPGRMRLSILVVMTAVAAVAGVLVATIEDGQAGLAVLLVPYVGLPLAAVTWLARSVSNARRIAMRGVGEDALCVGPSDRLAGLAIDVAVAGTALVVPLSALSHAEHEGAAAVLGTALGTIYLAAPMAVFGGTLGQSIVRLQVVDARTQRHIGLTRALVRSAIVVLEVAAASTVVLAVPALAELVSVATGGRSLTDRLMRTSVARVR